MSNEARVAQEREALYRDAVVWLQKEGGQARWEAAEGGGVRCIVSLRGQERGQSDPGSDEAARQNALIHAVDELQNSMPPAVEGP